MGRHHTKLDRRRWQSARLAVAARSRAAHGGLLRCEMCHKFSVRFEVDHKTPLDRGGAPYDPDNLQLLCYAPCHRRKTRNENVESPERLEWIRYVEAILKRDP